VKIEQLQNHTREWREKNFPEEHRTAQMQLMGVVEEVGELAHALLKMEQGIRGSREYHMGKIEDAIGDVTIYLCGLATALEIDMDAAIWRAWSEVRDRDWTKNKETGYVGGTGTFQEDEQGAA